MSDSEWIRSFNLLESLLNLKSIHFTMNNFKEMSLVNRAFLFSMMLLSGIVVCAQHAILAEPTGCGSNGTSGTWIVPCDVTMISVEV